MLRFKCLDGVICNSCASHVGLLVQMAVTLNLWFVRLCDWLEVDVHVQVDFTRW